MKCIRIAVVASLFLASSFKAWNAFECPAHGGWNARRRKFIDRSEEGIQDEGSQTVGR